MDNLAQMICQTDDVTDLSVDKIQRQIQVAWEQRAGARDFQRGSQQGRGSANKLSTVKRPQGNPTSQQQLQNNNPNPSTSLEDRIEGGSNDCGRGYGRGRGKRGRGTRGGRKQANQLDDDNISHASFHSSSHGQEKFEYSGLACSATAPLRPFVPPPVQAFRPPFYPQVSERPTYPEFHAALALSKELKVTPTIQTLKRLEISVEKTKDPRPQKKQKVANDEIDDIVDIHGSEYEDESAYGPDYGDDIMDYESGPSGTNPRFVITQQCKSPLLTVTQRLTELTITPPSCASSIQNGRRVDNNDYCKSARNTTICLNLSGQTKESQWIIDSGASKHYTHDINDFVEY